MENETINQEMYFPDGVWRNIMDMRKDMRVRHHWKSCYDSVMGELKLRGISYWKHDNRRIIAYWVLGPSIAKLFVQEMICRKKVRDQLGEFHRCRFQIETIEEWMNMSGEVYRHGGPTQKIYEYPPGPYGDEGEVSAERIIDPLSDNPHLW
tara:strand:+ start:19 stop:471 length:453 start_codon:yes stop_codon:yes gene_type:complete